jgi:hypothetical protein
MRLLETLEPVPDVMVRDEELATRQSDEGHGAIVLDVLRRGRWWADESGHPNMATQDRQQSLRPLPFFLGCHFEFHWANYSLACKKKTRTAESCLALSGRHQQNLENN